MDSLCLSGERPLPFGILVYKCKVIKQPQKCFTYGQYCQKIETVLVTVSMFEKGDAHDYLLRPSNKIAMINLVILRCHFILTHYWVKNK